ncbi:caspase family protein [Aerosakkonemataceae cyanobacterium BLCC-F50]|uniref:Caspase family protein n=1 Tax=Floridaenema flaviceps BLCC-F50 TaxID=3153642 RepID=A0ABV4XSG5_9CYAN
MAAQQSNIPNGSSLWALLIGIDEYLKKEDNLRGCVNDVEAMRIFLINQLGVPENHIRLLTNQEATRANILQAFEDLINNPDIPPGSQIFFHYSGHGSQMPDPKEPDGQKETIVPHDSRVDGVFDIPDKTLAALLDRLAERKGNNITVILDCCHSGTGTRDPNRNPNLAKTRNVQPDNRIPPPDLDTDIRTGVKSRGKGASGWATEGITHVLLAGCRDDEKSQEYLSRDQGKEVWHGALTYFTLQALRQITPNTTYADLYEQVAVKVNSYNDKQMPQCEGDRDRVVFGGVRVERDPFIIVQKVEGNEVTLSSGQIHGLLQGTEVALYPPEVRTKNDLPTPLTTVEVTSALATTAIAKIKEGMPIVTIPKFARGLITKHIYAGLRQTVALEADLGEENELAIAHLRQAIQGASPDSGSPYLEVLENPDQVADLRVKAANGKLSIYNSTGEQLVVPEDIKDEGGNEIAVLHSLESIVRYRTLQKLVNNESSELVGKVKLRLLRYMYDGSLTEELPAGAVGTGGEITLTFNPEREELNDYVLEVINESSQPIYAYLLLLNPDYSITLQYPQLRQQDEIKAKGGKLTIGFDNRKERLNFSLPEGWDSCRDYLKVIVTTNPTDFKLLEQKGLNVPPPQKMRAASSALEQLLDCVLSGKRFASSAAKKNLEDWATTSLSVTVVRGFQRKTLKASAETITLNDGLTLVKPEGFQGEVSVTTLSQGTRSIEGDPSLKLPPGLDRFPDLFQPVGRTGTRSVESSFGSRALVIAFDVDEASRQSITPENPLRLELPAVANSEGADLLPIAFDGEDYLLVGYGAPGGNAVDVVKLPSPVAPGKRGLGRTLQLFIYKKMGRYTGDIGLRRAELVNGKVEYRDIQRNEFKPGDKVALFVHGFTADTREMVETFAPFLRDQVLPYDHLLTWDYETFGSSVEENGKQLAQDLQQKCGFGSDDQITVHIYAHSMGCLVSRCAIELSGGHEFVDKLVMAGPPNKGSTLATLGRGIVYLFTVLINRASVIAPLGMFNYLLEQLYQQGIGATDLTVNSPILDRLNALKEPSNVPYLVLAGENQLSEEEHDRLNRLAQKLLDRTLDNLFGEQNDIAVGLSSMRGVRGGAYSNLRVEVLDCDHFHYFQTLQGREAVKRWVIG